MDQKELKNIIKKIAGNILGGKSIPAIETPTPEDKLPIKTKYSRFNILNKFPEMIVVLENLLTNDFELFIKEIFWVAPRPTTFKIILINGQHFFLMFDPKSWTAQVEGKKYWLIELRDSELAAESISRILRYGEIKYTQNKTKSEEETSIETSTTDTPEEESPIEEPEDETPEPEV